jgi:hypothetical protein
VERTAVCGGTDEQDPAELREVAAAAHQHVAIVALKNDHFVYARPGVDHNRFAGRI